ncbi:D-alanyl-D-alanine carboxypeptidase family protein [Sphaerimonospora cavernae]|uniref:D-alanyl-D-alanine carboxypeptidase family protein n=1 Tax=Sphaerimonospora cavernae TaxID=1740611 RepID=A0ABV6U2P9_9ACTN
MPTPRSVRLIAVVTAMTSLSAGVPYGTTAEAAAATRSTTRSTTRATVAKDATAWSAATVEGLKGKDPTTLTELRRQAQQAYKGIEDATKVLKSRQKRFESTQKQLAAKLTQLQAATQELNKLRRPLSDLVQGIYQDPAMTGISPFTASGDDTAALRAMSDLDYLANERNTVLGDAARLQRQQERLAAEAQELRSANLLQEAQLDAQIKMLRQRSSALVKSLTKALTKLGVKIGKANRGGCDPTRVGVAEQYPNGLLPQNILCPLPQRGEELRADAAIAFADLNLAYQRRFGTPICISDSYRSLAEQQSVYWRRPGLAATPGKSNHGLGLAVDLCGGVQSFRSVQFNWLEANGKRFGWIHPDWAYRSPFEPWHWEYDPEVGSLL